MDKTWKRKSGSPFDQVVPCKSLSERRLEHPKKFYEKFCERKRTKIECGLQTPSTKVAKSPFGTSFVNHFTSDQNEKICDPALHISTPNSPPYELQKPSRKQFKSVAKTLSKNWIYNFRTSETPEILPSISLISSNSNYTCQVRSKTKSISFTNQKRTKKPLKRTNCVQELFQDITFSLTPNKVPEIIRSREASISPCQSPQKVPFRDSILSSNPKSPRKFVLHRGSESSLQENKKIAHSKEINKNKGSSWISGITWQQETSEKLSDLKQKSKSGPEIEELSTPVKSENKGTSWIGGIAWQPKTPLKSPGNQNPPDSGRKRKYFVSGGFAQQLKKLEQREQATLNIERHKKSYKLNLHHQLLVTALDLSISALPLAYCKDKTTEEELILILPAKQVSSVVVGSTLKVSAFGLRTMVMHSSPIICPANDIEIVESEKHTIAPHIVYRWQCPCRSGADFNNLSCPANQAS